MTASGTARIWDASSGGEVATLAGHTSGVQAASFSANGKWVVTASLDRTAKIWDASSGGEVATLAGHTGIVVGASFSADGRRVVTASYDGTARIWAADVELLQVLIRERTSLCLDPAFREQTLGETPEEAERIYQACRRCLKRFREMRSTASSDMGIQAIREYKRCVQQAR